MKKPFNTVAYTLILLGFSAFFYYVVLYAPTLNSIDELELDIDKISHNLESNKKELNTFEILKKDLLRKPPQKNLSEKIIPEARLALPQWIHEMTSESKRRNLQVLRFEPQPPEFYDTHLINHFNVEVEGYFSQVLGFIDKIRNDGKVLYITAVDIVAAHEPSQNQKVMASFKLTHYQKGTSATK